MQDAMQTTPQPYPHIDLHEMGAAAVNLWMFALALAGLGSVAVAAAWLLTLAPKEAIVRQIPTWLLGSLLSLSSGGRSVQKKAVVVEGEGVEAVPSPCMNGPQPPRHVAVVMDGNRRYGKKMYGDGLKGHWDGGDTLSNFIDWSIAHGVQILTVYAFSTENWNRPQQEVDTLMHIFEAYTEKIRRDSIAKGVQVRLVSSDPHRLPKKILQDLRDLEKHTAHCTTFKLNICVSYGSRREIVNAVQSLAAAAAKGDIAASAIDEAAIDEALATAGLPDPDILIRTSECRLSNFLLWQLAYSELVFLDKLWPEVTEEDLVAVINNYQGRQRRFGK